MADMVFCGTSSILANSPAGKRQILAMCKARDPEIVKFMEDHIIRAGRDLVAALLNRRTSGTADE